VSYKLNYGCGPGVRVSISVDRHFVPRNLSRNQMFSSLTPPKKAQLRAPLSPLQIAWTGFGPNLYSGGSSSAGPALVEIATARSFILNRGIVTDTETLL